MVQRIASTVKAVTILVVLTGTAVLFRLSLALDVLK
jgi:hypothetical protein